MPQVTTRHDSAGCRTRVRAHGWRGVVATALMLILPPVALSCSAWAQPASSPQTYRLAAGDRVSLTIFGQAELSGDLVIDMTGNINIPFVGPVEIASLTVRQGHERIVRRLADGILTKPSVNLGISELRPVFITGDVRTGGPQPFRFGMNVKLAIAAAGGFGTLPPNQSAAITDFLQSDERVRQLTLQRDILTIRRARLEAQRDGAEHFSMADETRGQSNGALSELIILETETFNSQAAIQKAQVDLLRAQKPRLNNEIDALAAQIATRQKQLDLVKKHSEQYSRLVKQGLGLTSSEMQLRLTEATYESEIWNLTAQIARLRMDLGALDVRIQDTEVTFKRQVIADLRDIGEKLKEIEVVLPVAREIRTARLQQASNLAEIAGSRTITVTRNRDGKPETFQAGDMTPLEPGDVIEVHLVSPERLNLARSPATPPDVTRRSSVDATRDTALLPSLPR